MYIHDIIRASQNILECIHDGIAVVDKQGIIVYVNDANYRITGVESHQFLGNKVADIVPDSHIPQVLTSGSKLIGVKTKVGHKHVISNIVPIMYDGKIEGAISIFKDVSEIIRLNKKLEDANSTIRHLYEKLNFLADADSNMVVGHNEKIAHILKIAQKASQVTSTVLLQGESGTGKEVFAKFIHRHSARASKPFITINCAAIPESLLESELFGYEEGAFTGAKKGGRPGMFELANHGTIFLDEIGDMNPMLQAKLLRVLQNREIMRVGGTKLKQIDVRVIAATNKDLKKLVQEETFREDLYYRLEVIQIKIPPLRERKEDIHLYINYAIQKIGNRLGKNTTISPRALKKLINYQYPGNFRELENIIELCIVSDEDNIIDIDDLPDNIDPQMSKIDCMNLSFSHFPTMSEIEETVLKQAMQKFQSKSTVAKYLNISRATLYRKLKEYNIPDNE